MKRGKVVYANLGNETWGLTGGRNIMRGGPKRFGVEGAPRRKVFSVP